MENGPAQCKKLPLPQMPGTALSEGPWHLLSTSARANHEHGLGGMKAAGISVPRYLQEHWKVRYQPEECCCLSFMPAHGLEKLSDPSLLPKIAGKYRHLLKKKCLGCSWVLLLENSHHFFLTQKIFPLKFTQCISICE